MDGKITGQKVKVLGTTTWLNTVLYYDDYGRVIQSNSNNYLSGTNVVTTEYSFTNKISLVLKNNTAICSGVNKSYAITNRYVYDNADRLIDVYQKINSEAEVQLSRVAYSERGLVKE